MLQVVVTVRLKYALGTENKVVALWKLGCRFTRTLMNAKILVEI